MLKPSRREDQSEWRDAASGYVRRIVSPHGEPQPMRTVEVDFPARVRVAFESGPRDERVYQQIWVLEGEMEVTVVKECYRLREGDCLTMQRVRPTMFYNPMRHAARYAVVSLSELR
jgi:quercetin dioxygenase-like cupin family protein